MSEGECGEINGHAIIHMFIRLHDGIFNDYIIYYFSLL